MDLCYFVNKISLAAINLDRDTINRIEQEAINQGLSAKQLNCLAELIDTVLILVEDSIELNA